MPSSTVKQAKVMSALTHGWHPSKGSVAKIPVKVAKDFHAADAGHKYGKGMHKGDKTKKALRTAKKYASGGKAKSNLIHATEDFRRSANIEDRRHEDVDRFHDSAYFPPAPVPVFNPSEQSGQLPDALGAFDLDKKTMGFAGGGDVDDNQPDPFAAEKFIAPSVAEQSAKMAGKDVETIKGIGSAIAHTADLPRQALEGSAEDVQHLGEEDYNPKSVGPATEAAMNVIGGAGIVPAEANALRTGVGLKSATANLNSFDRFQQLEANGVKPTQNYNQTGWYRGEDRMPRYWIDDKGARLRDENLHYIQDQYGDQLALIERPHDAGYGTSASASLGDVWQHDKLYDAHPWLKNMPVVQHPMKGGVHGYYDALDHTIHINELSPEDFHDTLHHEVVHAIQHEEGFTGGGNVERFLPEDYHEKLGNVQEDFIPIGNALAEAGAPIWGIDATAMNRIAFRNLKDLDSGEREIRQTLRNLGNGYWERFVDNAKRLGELQKTTHKAHQDYLHIAGESEARDAPHLRNNPQAIKPYQIPMHVNPEVKRKNFTLGSTNEHWPPPSSRWGEGAPGSELPEGFVPDGVYEPKEPYAKGGRVEAEKALPANHQLGMQVPKGGSMCANCKFLASPTTCGNKGFIKWNGKPELPAPANEYCCDLYGHDKPEHKAEGGKVAKKEEDPKEHEFQDFSDGGLIDSAVPGRTDKHPMKVQPGSYVLPADFVSAMGQNNTKAGADIISKMFQSAPYGLKPMTQKAQKFHFDSFPSIGHKAEGGKTDVVPIIAAGGEIVLTPDEVKLVGNGDIAAGHKILDKLILMIRKDHIAKLKKLYPPKK